MGSCMSKERGRRLTTRMAVFYPPFVDPANATLARVADHIEYVANVCGRRHVGIGSDFDGMDSSVAGLEDASKYPHLVSPPHSGGGGDGSWLTSDCGNVASRLGR